MLSVTPKMAIDRKRQPKLIYCDSERLGTTEVSQLNMVYGVSSLWKTYQWRMKSSLYTDMKKNHQATWLSEHNKVKYNVYNMPPFMKERGRNKNISIYLYKETLEG